MSSVSLSRYTGSNYWAMRRDSCYSMIQHATAIQPYGDTAIQHIQYTARYTLPLPVFGWGCAAGVGWVSRRVAAEEFSLTR